MTLEYIIQRQREAFDLIHKGNPPKKIKKMFAKSEKDFIKKLRKK
jgi:hypothetical protein